MTQSYNPVALNRQQSPATLVSHTPKTEHAFRVSPFYSQQLNVGCGRKSVKRGPLCSKFLVGAVASIASFVTILTLLTVCRTTKRRLNTGAAAQRNLSDAEDEKERSDILEQCLDLEGELGLRLVASEPSAGAREAESRLTAMLYESTADFQRKQGLASQNWQDEVQLSPHKIPRFDDSWPSTLQPQTSVGAFWQYSRRLEMGHVAGAFGAGAWLGGDSDVVFSANRKQGRVSEPDEKPNIQRDIPALRSRSSALYEGEVSARPLASLSVGRTNIDGDAMSPDAWLDNPLANTHPHAFHHAAVEAARRHPTVAGASAVFFDAGSTAAHDGLAGRVGLRVPRTHSGGKTAAPSLQGEEVEQVEHQEGAFHINLDVAEPLAPAKAARTTQTSSRGGEPCEAGDISQHPFVRLPVVKAEDIHRSFRPEFALSHDLNVCSPMEIYTTMRSLFAKASLTAEEVETLMKEAELLANYAATKLLREHKRCKANYIIRKLSSLLMVFDYLVCTVELLGDKMNTGAWWTKFTQKFRTEYFFPEEARTVRTEILNKFVNRLSAALSVYKKLKRPPFHEIIELKRMILNHSYKGSQLSHRLWQLWIQDDQAFSCPGDGFGSLSDSKEPSQGKAKEP
ncbi:hypothetical protein, conserved [Eimeria brunetti]|uniref:Transmembrane protein n=1 Tax=Eimeria brunetti TaxID=51314 RepID=U6LZX3_9EIME|nr:hypothetical protein, conserved [Eimeria brunetti]